MDKLKQKTKGTTYTSAKDLWSVQGADYNLLVDKINELINSQTSNSDIAQIESDLAALAAAMGSTQTITTAVIAAAGSSADPSEATQITDAISYVQYCYSNIFAQGDYGVMLPHVADDESYTIINRWGNSPLYIYAQLDERISVDSGMASVGLYYFYELQPGQSIIFVKFNSTIWVGQLLHDERTANKVTSIVSTATDKQYPSAKAVYTAISNIPSTSYVQVTGTNRATATAINTHVVAAVGADGIKGYIMPSPANNKPMIIYNPTAFAIRVYVKAGEAISINGGWRLQGAEVYVEIPAISSAIFIKSDATSWVGTLLNDSTWMVPQCTVADNTKVLTVVAGVPTWV